MSWVERSYSANQELTTVIPLTPGGGRNLESPPWCYLLWGVPAAMIAVSQVAYQRSELGLPLAGSIWAISVLWIGVGCFLNGRSCGRVHCKIDGVAMSLLAVVAFLNVLSVISISWSTFWIAFFLVLAASFVPELVWKRYA